MERRFVRTLARAVHREDSGGTPLPTVYPNLEQAGIQVRTGVVSVILGEPGSFKSTLALNMLLLWSRLGITGLYISAEDDDTIVASRIAAMETGDTVEHATKVIRDGAYDSVLKPLSEFVRFEFRALTIQKVADRLEAFRKAHGAFPRVLYIDNLMSMVDDPTDYHGQMTYLRDLAQIAQTAPTPCAILVLHHAREGGQKKNKTAPHPPPLWAMHGKVSHFPKLVMSVDTVGNSETSDLHMGVAPVKNNYGPQDKTGETYEDFWVIPESARIRPMT
jgi:hypothetical protein